MPLRNKTGEGSQKHFLDQRTRSFLILKLLFLQVDTGGSTAYVPEGRPRGAPYPRVPGRSERTLRLDRPGLESRVPASMPSSRLEDGPLMHTIPGGYQSDEDSSVNRVPRRGCGDCCSTLWGLCGRRRYRVESGYEVIIRNGCTVFGTNTVSLSGGPAVGDMSWL